MKSQRKSLVTIWIICLIAGCSTPSRNIATGYVSPAQYRSYNCDQLSAETYRLQARTSELGAHLDQAASNDVIIGVVGSVVFWPALFALGGTREQEAEYARLKGEYESVQKAQISKKCAILLPASSPQDSSLL